MPWYRTGTVAITAGQNTVTGTGTSFSANARVGDAFQGPDGRWYEVTNIASGTVLSILPAYQGATVTGGTYGLAPMQGYVKDSADRLRQLIDQFGTIIAGLGTASTATLTTSTTDATTGRVLKVGDLGMTGTSLSMGNTVDANTLTYTGRFAFGNGGINLPATGTAYYLDVQVHAALVLQKAWGMTNAVATKSYTRILISGVWSLWSDKLSRTDIVGTVSQSGGVPTGAIIERGTNANGEYIKLADGTLICSITTSPSLAVTNAYGSGSYGSTSWAFPLAFVGDLPRVMGTAYMSGRLMSVVPTSSQTLSGTGIFVLDTAPNNLTGTVLLKLTAFGRWY
ncbi:phage tail protein [Pseudomonas sp. PCH44]|uniref:pyocin knob domain-containing protein n=1 Tax=Pseudomonas sp. PCH44 TaxID=2800904 RepID=UPI001BAF3A18|nr:pyocin knob domain-containing protein [Pseudomonas sp. PCH44]MBS3184557.1 phage tail protein [Pseudomonas sp. PCH44]